MKLCINCDTENALDAVFCSECGMSLMQAPTGEEALKLKRAFQAESRLEGSKPLPERPPSLLHGSVRQLAGLLAGLYFCVILALLEEGGVEALVVSSPSGACLATVFLFLFNFSFYFS